MPHVFIRISSSSGASCADKVNKHKSPLTLWPTVEPFEGCCCSELIAAAWKDTLGIIASMAGKPAG